MSQRVITKTPETNKTDNLSKEIESLSKDIYDVKKSQMENLGQKNTITKIKNSAYSLKSQMERTDNRIS